MPGRLALPKPPAVATKYSREPRKTALAVSFLVVSLFASKGLAGEQPPFARQVARQIALLKSDSANARAGAAEALGFLRAYEAESALLAQLNDEAPIVRRQVALALAWCGGREAIGALLTTLDDEDWVTRQSAHVSLTNLTGMEFPFDSMASTVKRAERAKVWRDWWSAVPTDRPPAEVLALAAEKKPWVSRWRVTASSTYRGPASVLTDGQLGPAYWQTKGVIPPQSVTIDLGQTQDIGQVTIHQYGPRFVMTDYELATSRDNKTFETVAAEQGTTPVKLVVSFARRPARYVRVTSRGSINSAYLCTFREIQIDDQHGSQAQNDADTLWRIERGLRGLGSLGGEGSTTAVLAIIGSDLPTAEGSDLPTAEKYRPLVCAGIQSLGRLRHEAGFERLLELLDDPMWARRAANALGDFGDARAVPLLIDAYARYAKRLNGQDPAAVPRDDKMGFPSEDRMLETPYAIAYTLCRLPLTNRQDVAALRNIAPLIMANLPGDHDTFMLYQPEIGHLLTRHLLQVAGLRQEACEHAMTTMGQTRRVAKPADDLEWSPFDARRISSWLPAVCTDREDVPRLVALLEHEDGWVRINAAKALGWIGDRRSIGPITKVLAAAKAEAEFGYSGVFKDEEYNDPAPRWREALVRALGQLQAHDQTQQIIDILDDEQSVLDVRHAAAEALADLDNASARKALAATAKSHSFHSVRNIAADAIRHRLPQNVTTVEKNLSPRTTTKEVSPNDATDAEMKAVVFIQGDNSIPNTIGTVEQADRWRQTYVVTDSGPVYRPGRNIFILQPPRPDAQPTPLTHFADGFVGEIELSWDASQVIFTRREESNPWWHVYQMNIDGSRLTQLTKGPYHDVGPAFLPDGRIVFSTSRAGIRDEYHGYPCTALWVMDADGRQMKPIATNIGRDNEPAVLSDGRVAFSRLEVFYSRNKTELTLHAVRPDGTQDVVLYGPERRKYWRNLDHGMRTPADGQESPLTHRVLRMTQPQAMPDGRHIVVVTQGGLALVGPSRDHEVIITPNNKTRSYTTPFPLPGGDLLCSSTLKTADRTQVDLGLYRFDPINKKFELIYNDPKLADFEARPVIVRRPPPVLAPNSKADSDRGQLICSSVFESQDAEALRRARLVRVIEGVPVVARHSTQTNPWPVWQNHGGTLARVLGTLPIAPDGSFHVEVPPDRLLQLQVLDSDRRVIGNQLTWISVRPGETKSCVGCHDNPNATTSRSTPLAALMPPIDLLPNGDELRYRAKAWFKGHLPAEIEHRTRSVRAVNLLAR